MSVDLAEKLLNGCEACSPLVDTKKAAVDLALNLFTSNSYSTMPASGPLARYLGASASPRACIAELMPTNGWWEATHVAARVRHASPAELDAPNEDGIPFALLSHAPRDTFVRLSTAPTQSRELDRELLVPDLSCIPQAAMMGAWPINVRTISLAEARNELDAPDKAGWIELSFA
jgi:hypothetical protein